MIETARLRCEVLTPGHAAAMYEVLRDPAMYAFIPDTAPASVAALRARYERLSVGQSGDGTETWVNWLLFEKRTGAAVGYFQVTVRGRECSIGYVLNPRFWGRGLATEAGVRVVDEVFRRFAVDAVTAEIDPRNLASVALVRRLGFGLKWHDLAEGDDVFEVTREGWHPYAGN